MEIKNKSNISNRMKQNYESRAKMFLTRRTPVIIRLDGKAFHTYTKGLEKPYDEGLIQDMNNTAIELCKQIQGVKCAYVQSDEISLLLTDYDNLQTQAWFDYNVQKMCSISASICSSKFNQLRTLREFIFTDNYSLKPTKDFVQFLETNSKLANFDSRCFNIPKEEINNYFIWRQQDTVRNSIQMLARSLYSHKECTNKNTPQLQEMCFQKGVNWNDLDSHKKRGRFIVKQEYWDDELVKINYVPSKNKINYYTENLIKTNNSDIFYKGTSNIAKDVEIRSKWEVVEETPNFTKQTEIINNLI